MENPSWKKPKILGLHGHGCSAKILQEEMKRWPEFMLEMMDLVYIDAPFLLEGKSGNEGKFDPPYYEWYRAYESGWVSDEKSFDECIAYIEEKMIELGPFDGVLGVSQGALVTAALPGMQREGVALVRVPRIKFIIVISGGKFGGSYFPAPELAKNAFSSPINIPSLHVIGEKDNFAWIQLELLGAFVEPTLLYHHGGHGVPHLDDNGVKIVVGFLNQIQSILEENKNKNVPTKMCCSFWDIVASVSCFRKRARVQNLI